MIPDNVKDIIDSLLKKTSSGEAIWNKSSSNGYRLALKSATVVIYVWHDDELDIQYANFFILNDRGDKIEDIQYSENDINNFIILDRLYKEISRKYLKVDETLGSLLSELKSSTVIGKKENEDDLPF